MVEKGLTIVYTGKESPPALNEIYISRANLTKTAEIEIKFQNEIVQESIHEIGDNKIKTVITSGPAKDSVFGYAHCRGRRWYRRAGHRRR